MTEIKDLISYQVHMVANLLSRGAELRYRREFGVSLWEWRTIALLGAADEPHSLGDLARAAGIDKSQMSRVVSGLTKRKLVMRAANDEDGRGVQLRLEQERAQALRRTDRRGGRARRHVPQLPFRERENASSSGRWPSLPARRATLIQQEKK